MDKPLTTVLTHLPVEILYEIVLQLSDSILDLIALRESCVTLCNVASCGAFWRHKTSRMPCQFFPYPQLQDVIELEDVTNDLVLPTPSKYVNKHMLRNPKVETTTTQAYRDAFIHQFSMFLSVFYHRQRHAFLSKYRHSRIDSSDEFHWYVTACEVSSRRCPVASTRSVYRRFGISLKDSKTMSKLSHDLQEQLQTVSGKKCIDPSELIQTVVAIHGSWYYFLRYKNAVVANRLERFRRSAAIIKSCVSVA